VVNVVVCSRMRCLLFLLAASAAAGAPCGSPFNVLTFGARGDGVHEDGPAIQAAVAAAAACGGGVIQLPYTSPTLSTFLSGPLFLESNTVLHIAPGTRLLSSTNFSLWLGSINKPSGFATGPPGFINGGRCLELPPAPCTTWHKLRNVTLTGGGSIDGNGPTFWGASTWWPTVPRPYMLELHYVDGLEVREGPARAPPPRPTLTLLPSLPLLPSPGLQAQPAAQRPVDCGALHEQQHSAGAPVPGRRRAARHHALQWLQY
jgi:hypothetical protein